MIQERIANMKYIINHIKYIDKRRVFEFINNNGNMEKGRKLRKDKTRGTRNQEIKDEEQNRNMKSSGHKGPGNTGGTALTGILPNHRVHPAAHSAAGDAKAVRHHRII